MHISNYIVQCLVIRIPHIFFKKNHLASKYSLVCIKFATNYDFVWNSWWSHSPQYESLRSPHLQDQHRPSGQP